MSDQSVSDLYGRVWNTGSVPQYASWLSNAGGKLSGTAPSGVYKARFPDAA
jgi:hypothetical protein